MKTQDVAYVALKAQVEGKVRACAVLFVYQNTCSVQSHNLPGGLTYEIIH